MVATKLPVDPYLPVAAMEQADRKSQVPVVPVNVPVNERWDKVLRMVQANPKATAQKMALALGVTDIVETWT